MQKITPFLWFDDKAEEAINFYTSIFKDSETLSLNKYPHEVPNMGGKVMAAEFRLLNQEFKAFDAGPHFKFTPALSFFVETNNEEDLDYYWQKLSEGGKVLMEYQKYDFSDKYGWVDDKYGVSWQISIGERSENITPSLLFVRDNFGKAKEALKLYTEVFDNTEITQVVNFPEEIKGVKDAVMYSKFKLEGQDFILMEEGSDDHKFNFTEAISLFVSCKDQEEVDYFWDKLTADGGEESMCGWLKDKFGVSWQIIPNKLGELLSNPDPEKSGKAMQAMLKMSKIIINDLE